MSTLTQAQRRVLEEAAQRPASGVRFTGACLRVAYRLEERGLLAERRMARTTVYRHHLTDEGARALGDRP